MNLSVRMSNAGRLKLAIARATACSIILLVLPGCHVFDLRHPDPAPALPPNFEGVATQENSSQLGIDEFYHDPNLTCLIDQAVFGNRELKILNEEVQVAGNEVLARSGAYLPFLSGAAGAGLDRASHFSLEGAGIRDDPFLPNRFFSNPHGNYLLGTALTWQLDIYRQLRTARDAASLRYVSAFERRNFFVTRLVAEVAENYYRLMALDKRLETLDSIIQLQERSLRIAVAEREAARNTDLPVQRFRAEVFKNQSEKLIVNQEIIQVENRINFLLNRFPQRVDRDSTNFFELNINTLYVGVPSQLLLNRPDIRQAERELAAAGLDIYVARINFFPQLVITGGVGLEAFNPRYLFEPNAVAGNIAGGLVAPVVNFRAIRAQYYTANARQLQTLYNYQRTVLEAFTQVINQMTAAQNYRNSIEIKKQQLASLDSAVEVANNLFRNPRVDPTGRVDYIDVLLAQNALLDARTALIQTKAEQLAAIVNTYQALGGGDLLSMANRGGYRGPFPCTHTVCSGENFATISQYYYKSGRYSKALWAANQKAIPALDRLAVGDKINIPPADQLDPALIEEVPAQALPAPAMAPAAGPANVPPPPPPADLPGPFAPPPTAGLPGGFRQNGMKDLAVKATGGGLPPASSPPPATAGR